MDTGADTEETGRLLVALRECFLEQPPDVTAGAAHAGEQVHFLLRPCGGQGWLLRISSMRQVQAQEESWQQAMAVLFSKAVALVSEAMHGAGLVLQMADDELERLPARRGKYLSTVKMGEAVWLRGVDEASASGMREASEEEVLVHEADMLRLRAAIDALADRILGEER